MSSHRRPASPSSRGGSTGRSAPRTHVRRPSQRSLGSAKRDGSVRRSRPLNAASSQRSLITQASSISGNNWLFVASNGYVAAIDLTLYAVVVWQQDAARSLLASGPASLALRSDYLYMAYGGQVLRILAEDGRVVWHNTMKGLGTSETSIVVDAKHVYAGTRGYVECMDRANGVQLHRVNLAGSGWADVNLALHNGILYASAAGTVWAIDATTLQIHWFLRTKRGGCFTMVPVSQPGAEPVLQLGGSGFVQTIAVSMPDAVLRETNLKNSMWNPVSLLTQGRNTYVATNGQVSARDSETMEELWLSRGPFSHTSSLLLVDRCQYSCIKAGWMYKKGSGVSKAWKKRLFCLTPSALIYFNTAQQRIPTRVMQLANATIDARSILGAEDHASYSFTIRDNTRVVPPFYLDCENATDKENWVDAISVVTVALGGAVSMPEPLIEGVAADLRQGMIVPSSRVLYVGGDDAVSALDPSTGAEHWRTELPSKLLRAHLVPLQVVRGILYASVSGIVYGLDACTGRVIMTYDVARHCGFGNVTLTTMMRPDQGVDSSACPLIPYWEKQRELLSSKDASKAGTMVGRLFTRT